MKRERKSFKRKGERERESQYYKQRDENTFINPLLMERVESNFMRIRDCMHSEMMGERDDRTTTNGGEGEGG